MNVTKQQDLEQQDEDLQYYCFATVICNNYK